MTTNEGKPDSPNCTVARYRYALLIVTGLFVAYQHHSAVTQMAEMRAARLMDQAYVRSLEDTNRHSATIIADLTKENTELHMKVSHLIEMGSDTEHIQERETRYRMPIKVTAGEIGLHRTGTHLTQSDRRKGAPDDPRPH
jgi:hypothetical protein